MFKRKDLITFIVGMLSGVIISFFGLRIINNLESQTPRDGTIAEAVRITSKWKTTDDRIRVLLFHTHPYMRELALRELARHPDIKVLDLIIWAMRRESMWLGQDATWVLKSYGAPAIPYIIKELVVEEKTELLKKYLLALSEITGLPRFYKDEEEMYSVINWWMEWWTQNQERDPIYWKKDAIKENRMLLTSEGWGSQYFAICRLYELTKQPFGNVVATDPESAPLLGSDPEQEAHQEWVAQYGDIEKWIKWIDENYDYLYWSSEENHFVVNEEAKAKGIPVDPVIGHAISTEDKPK